MKKFFALLMAAMMMLSVVSFAHAEDVEIEFLYHKSETDAMNAMQTVIRISAHTPICRPAPFGSLFTRTPLILSSLFFRKTRTAGAGSVW